MNGRSFAGVGFLGGVYVVDTVGRSERSAERFLNFKGGGVGDGSVSGFGSGGREGSSGLLFLNEECRRISSRARLRDGVRKGVDPGTLPLEVPRGGDSKGYSVAPG